MTATKSFLLSPSELSRLDQDGYVVRQNVFTRRECDVMAGECEAMVATLTARKRNQKVVVGSYLFERQDDLETAVKWEPDAPDLVQGVEPFAHFWPSLKEWGLDPRLVDPCKAISRADELVLFTEKLNLKRSSKGGPIVLHQDYPYWEPFGERAKVISTAMIFLDDATRKNGCLEVAPGSHKIGKQPQRTDAEGPGRLEMDPAKFDMTSLISLEVKAGAVAFFGAFLAHRSLPNRSGEDRRALLYSYQPAGNAHAREFIKWEKGKS